MNNVIQLNKPSTQPAVADHSDAASIYFPVALQDVHVNGRTVEGYQAVVREDTGEVLGIHGDGYKLVPNEEVFPAFEDALSRSELNLSGMTVSDAVSHGGAKTARTYGFRNTAVLSAKVIRSICNCGWSIPTMGAWRFPAWSADSDCSAPTAWLSVNRSPRVTDGTPGAWTSAV